MPLTFAGGILLGQSRVLRSGASVREDVLIALVVIGSLLIFGAVLTWRNFLWLGGAASLLCCLSLGLLAGFLTQKPLSPEHILSRLSAGQVPLRTPVRWHGVLRVEPARLPWGYGIEVDLTGLEKADGFLPVVGGMRLGFTPHDNDPFLPELHAGDEISVLAEGRLPLLYRDAGAFNRREFLSARKHPYLSYGAREFAARKDWHDKANMENACGAAAGTFTRAIGCDVPELT